MKFKNYSPSYTITTYKYNQPYKFTTTLNNLKKFQVASQEIINKHSSLISTISNSIDSETSSCAMIPLIGLVINKHQAKSPKDTNYIIVLFNIDNNYYTQKYVTNNVKKQLPPYTFKSVGW